MRLNRAVANEKTVAGLGHRERRELLRRIFCFVDPSS